MFLHDHILVYTDAHIGRISELASRRLYDLLRSRTIFSAFLCWLSKEAHVLNNLSGDIGYQGVFGKIPLKRVGAIDSGLRI